MATQTQHIDHTRRGIGTILVAVLLFCIGDAAGKWLGLAGYSPPQIAFFRYLFGLVPVAVMIWSSGLLALRTRRPFAHAGRAILLFAALVSLFTGLRYLPLAEAIAIAFTAPLFITALSYPVLGERVGPRRWAAVSVGFIGALIMIRPGTEAFQPEALWMVASALFFALAMLFTRRLAITETSVAMFAYTTVGAGIVSTPFVVATWQTPALDDLWIFILLGVVGGFAAYLMIVAYRSAPAAVIAPFEYTALIWTTILGWILWREEPGWSVGVGAAIIVLCGWYITRRESVSAGLE